jgi:murein DD-endopeptidase MepM/ murein hydrolase activator NlpD
MIRANLLKNYSNYIKSLSIILFVFLFLGILKVNAAASILITPKEVIQGEPVLVQVSGAKISDIKKLTFNKQNLNIFTYQNKPSALLGIDLRGKSGDYTIRLELKNGSSTEKILTVKDREKYEVAMEVPESLGGNSATNQTKVVDTLAQENATLAVIKTFAKSLWTNKFIYPISGPIVITDEYGYSRLTGAYTLAHKGVDLRAKEGTKVVAMNRGIVRVAKTFQIYGKTVVIDHGYGVMTFYLHLSKIKVNVGELVQQGQLIGLSGNTGYVIGPHLHLSVRINNISIDPIKFLDLFK